MCPRRVGRKVAETMYKAQRSPPGRVAGSGLLGLHRLESMANSTTIYRNVSRLRSALGGRFSYYSKWGGVNMLHDTTQSLGGEDSSHPAVLELR